MYRHMNPRLVIGIQALDLYVCEHRVYVSMGWHTITAVLCTI